MVYGGGCFGFHHHSLLYSFIATILYHLGFKYCVSTGIHGDTTYGYGELDDNGFWEYNINPKLVEKKK